MHFLLCLNIATVSRQVGGSDVSRNDHLVVWQEVFVACFSELVLPITLIIGCALNLIRYLRSTFSCMF